MAKNMDIFGVQRDKTAVKSPLAPAVAPDTGDETVGERLRPTVKMFSLKKKIRKNVEAIPAPKEMPENEVKPPKKEEE